MTVIKWGNVFRALYRMEGRGEGMRFERKEIFAITLPRESLLEILNETPKPAVSGLSFEIF